MCQKWDIFSKDLTVADVDRIFITTNFEEEDILENDDSMLCRFEFLECIVRIGKAKFFEKGAAASISKAVEKLILEYVLPNSIEKMEWQRFRDDHLWTLDVDDLFKKNIPGIETLWRKGGLRPGVLSRKFFTKDDSINLVAMSSKLVIEGVNTSILEGRERETLLAFSLSKMTIINEMKDNI